MVNSPAINPLKAVSIAGHVARRDSDGILTAPCPSCDGRVHVAGPSMSCDNSHCSFQRGGPVDYLAARFSSYDDAVAAIGQLDPYYRDNRDTMAGHHAGRRKLLEFFFRLERDSCRPDAERLALKHMVSAEKIDPEAFRASHLYMTSRETGELFGILADLGLDVPSDLAGPTVAIPYWAWPSVISRIWLVGLNSREPRHVDVDPHRWSWFGLPQLNPACKEVVVWPSFAMAMNRQDWHRANDPFRFPTSLSVDVRFPFHGWLPGKLVFQGSDLSWRDNLPGWSFMEGFEDATFEDGDAGEMTLPELMTRLLRRSTGPSAFRPFVDMCASMNLNPEIRNLLIAEMYRAGSGLQVETLRATLTRRLLDRDEKASYYESSEGYEAEKKGGAKVRITNFTIRLKKVTGFSALSELHYHGDMVVGNLTVPFDVPGSKFDNPSTLEKYLQPLQMLRPGGAASDEVLATVYNTSEFRKILTWLRVQSARIPRSRGIKTLGWSRRGDLFHAPGAVIDTAGIHEGITYHAEPDGDHHCFDSAAALSPALPGSVRGIHPVLAEIVSVMLSSVVRFYHGLKVTPLPVANNVRTRAIAMSLFRPFGQTHPLRLTNILPRNLDINRGLPCLIAGINELQAAKIQMAGAYFADGGLDLSGVTEEEADRAGQAMTALVLDTARRILAGGQTGFQEKRSVRPENRMAAEGTNLIRKDYLPDWPEPGYRYRSVDTVLEMRAEALVDLSRIDGTATRLSIPEPVWNGLVDRTDLVIELGLLCSSVSAGKPGAPISVDLGSAYHICREFYGEVPAFRGD